MKKPVIIISIICVLIIAGGVLVLTGVIDIKSLFSRNSNGSPFENVGNIEISATGSLDGSEGDSESVADDGDADGGRDVSSGAVVWIGYMDSYVLVDKNGKVISTTTTRPDNVMQLSGVGITKMIKGGQLEVDDEEALEYGLLVTNKLAAVGISDKGEVFISADHSAIVYLKNIKILLGQSDKLLEKLEALRKFYNKVIVLDGTLDMQEYDSNKMGYTFKLNDSDAGSSSDQGETEIFDEDDADNDDDSDSQDGDYGGDDDGDYGDYGDSGDWDGEDYDSYGDGDDGDSDDWDD